MTTWDVIDLHDVKLSRACDDDASSSVMRVTSVESPLSYRGSFRAPKIHNR
jgi:hypothetical protein